MMNEYCGVESEEILYYLWRKERYNQENLPLRLDYWIIYASRCILNAPWGVILAHPTEEKF